MPLYEYQCQKCDKKVVLRQRTTTEECRLTCPQCGGKDLARVFSTFSVGGGKARQPQTEAAPPGQPGPPGESSGPPGPEFHRFMVTNNPENLK